MNRTDAHKFTKLLIQFTHEAEDNVEILDVDPGDDTIQLRIWDHRGQELTRWVDPWTAAKVIEANCG